MYHSKIRKINESKKLSFFESDHHYEVNGRRLFFSVSKISNIKQFNYNWIDNIEWYQTYGNSLHNLYEWLALTYGSEIGEPPIWIFENIDAYLVRQQMIDKWMNWISQFDIKEIIAEELITNDVIGGKFDLMIVEKSGKIILIDYKTSNSIFYSHKIQINVYNYFLSKHYGINANELIVCQWHKENLNLTSYVIDFHNMQPFVDLGIVYEDLEKIETLSIRSGDKNIDYFKNLRLRG